MIQISEVFRYILNKKGRQLLAKLSKLHGNLTERKGDLIEATADQFAKILSRKELYRLLRETQW